MAARKASHLEKKAFRVPFSKDVWEVRPLATEPSPLDMKPRPGRGLVEVHPAKAGTHPFAVMLVAIARKATRQAAKAHISAGRLVKAAKA